MKKSVFVFALCLVMLFPCGRACAATDSISTTALLDQIAEQRGKVVLVNFFAAFCPPCRKEIPGLIRLRAEIPQDKLAIIGIALDQDLTEMENFIASCGFNYPVYYGGEEVAYAYRVASIPQNVLYDRDGKMVFNQAGYLPEESLRTLLDQLIPQE